MLVLHDFDATMGFAARHGLDLGMFTPENTCRDNGPMADKDAIWFHYPGCPDRRTVWVSDKVGDRRVGACRTCHPGHLGEHGWEDLLFTADQLTAAEADPDTVRLSYATAARLEDLYRHTGLTPRWEEGPTMGVLHGGKRVAEPMVSTVSTLRRIADGYAEEWARKHLDAKTATRASRCGYHGEDFPVTGYITVLIPAHVTSDWALGWEMGLASALHEADTLAEGGTSRLVTIPSDLSDLVYGYGATVVNIAEDTNPRMLTETLTVFDPDAGTRFEDVLTAVVAA